MTRRDKWKQRPCVVAYWAFKDEVRIRKVHVPVCDTHVTFVLPMPPSWSKKKRAAMDGAPHQQTPDVDNLVKALLDAIYANDCHVYDIRGSKFWGVDGKIIVKT
jgi:Holliday junction resolvase RusA-like endonuclease